MRLYFVRHGESWANVRREFSNSPHKHTLTPRGEDQARRLAASLAGTPFTRLYSSPVLRAAQTAQILGHDLGLDFAFTPALLEWNVGELEGTTDPAGWERHRQVQEDWFMRRQFEHRLPGGESYTEMRARFEPFVCALAEEDRGRDENVLLVAHGGLYIAMLPLVFTNLDLSFALSADFPNTAYALADARPDGLYCLEWCGEKL